MRAQGLSRTNERERGGNGGVPQKRCENLIRQKVTHKYTRKRCSGSVPYKKEKSVKKTVEKWSTNCFILYLPHKSKKVLCVSKSPLARWRDAEKRERNRKPDWDWTVCLKRSKCRAFGRMFFIIIIFFFIWYEEMKRLLLDYSIRSPFCPRERTHLITPPPPPPNRHKNQKEEKERPNLKNHMFLTYLDTPTEQVLLFSTFLWYSKGKTTKILTLFCNEAKI